MRTRRRYEGCNSGHCFGAWAVACCILLAAMAACVRADDVLQPQGAQPGLADLGLEELMNIEVVSASKKLQKLSEAPVPVFVITRDDIRRYGYRTLAEALRRVIGLYTFSDRNYEYVGLRGFGRPGGYNSRILVLVDGHRINDPIYDYGMVGEDFPLDIESVERIEVIKGPGSALWGTTALLGVINVITRKGSDSDTQRVVVEYGTHNRKKMFLEYGSAFDGGLDVYGSFSDMDSNGQGRIYFPEFDDPATNNGIAEGADGDQATRSYVSVSHKGLTFLFNTGRRRKVVPTATNGTMFNTDRTFTIDERTFAELSYERDVLRRYNGKLLVRLYQDEYTFNGDYFASGETLEYVFGSEFFHEIGEPAVATYDDNLAERWWGSELRYSQDISPRLSVTCGLEYQKAAKVRQWSCLKVPYCIPVFDVNSPFEMRSYYLQADLGINDSLRLVASTRLDDYSTCGNVWSPRAALIYAPSNSTALKLLYGKAFRAPDAYERDYHSDIFPYGNPSLKPEQITMTELVWEQKVSKDSRLVASLFRSRLSDLISQIDSPEGPGEFENFGIVRSDGVEIQLESRLANGLTSHFGLTGLHTWDVDTGQPIVNSPRFMVTGGVSIPLGSRKAYLTPEVQYIGRRKTLAGADIPSSAVVNLTIEARNISKDLDMSLGVYNLLDEETFVPSEPGYVQDRLPQDRRTFRFQLTRRF